ncbi:phage tail tape measure protein [Vibrio cholerae]|uniref:phage tail tape measure protein n=1 Tax=Vibrio cholerae TaxID=666 RepID=UPI001373544A|nr:phage tail tape measure protein [Vibrio cholerae]MCX9527034.1 phage tail tape measure protein [Vibrio cholerae]NAR20206.1 phage tail tape measure protein [Vibrio cholerae]NAR31718.1 phage tail tape measure protein [Vibrio cholerae]
MADKISLVLDTTVKGLEDIVSTTSAAERLTAAIVKQRGEVISLNSQLKKVEGYQSAIKRMEKLREQSKNAEQSVANLGQQLEENKQQATALKVAYSQTQSEIKGLNNQLKKASGDGAEQLQLQLQKARLRLDSLNTEMHQSKVRTSDLNTAYKKASQRVTDLSDKQTKQRDKLRSLASELKESGVNTRRLSDEQKRLEKQSEKATAAIAKQNSRMKEMQTIQSRIDSRNAKLSEIGSQATSLAIASAPMVASVWTAVKNESSFADVKKVVDMSPEEAAQLREWSLKTQASKAGGGLNANDINAMLATGGQSGISDLNELKRFVLDSAEMGVAFDMEAGAAGETLATFKAALGLDHEGAVGLAGLANYLSNNSNAKAKDIAGVMARQGASAQLAGFSTNDAAALSAAMLATGMGEERSATALKNISGRLTLGGAATGVQKAALGSIGFDAESLASDMQYNASGTFLEVLEAIKQAPLEEQSALITQIFGEESKGAVASLTKNTQLFQKTLKLASEDQAVHTKSLKDEFDSRVSTTENGLQLFMNKLNRLSVIVGNALLPALNWVLEPLGNLVSGIADFAEVNQSLTAAVGVGIAGFIALKGAMLAGKAASLIFGNALDKGKLFRTGLNRETNESGRAAQFATKQFSRLNETLWNSGRGGSGRGGRSGGSRATRNRAPRTRSRNPLARAYSFASSAFTHNRGALPLALGGGALAMSPAMAMAQDALDLGGDLAEGIGKGGLNKFIRPLSMAISGVNIAQALSDGDTKGAITEGGGLLGGMGGASLGAMLGTAVLPGIGTVIGGLAGSLLGDLGGEMFGGWLGDKLTNPPDKLMASTEVKENIEEREKKESVARSLPPIQISTPIYPSAGMDEKQLAQLVNQEVTLALERAFGMSGLAINDSLSVSSIDRG